jgi:hypothetical protein
MRLCVKSGSQLRQRSVVESGIRGPSSAVRLEFERIGSGGPGASKPSRRPRRRLRRTPLPRFAPFDELCAP